MKIPSRVILSTLDNVPEGMLEEHGDLTLEVDIMYINKIPFFFTTLMAIHFGTVEMIKGQP